MSTRPPLLYWNPATLACIEVVRGLNRGGVPVFFTIDAGPQVKAICPPEHEHVVADALGAIAGVKHIMVSGLGTGATLVEEE